MKKDDLNKLLIAISRDLVKASMAEGDYVKNINIENALRKVSRILNTRHFDL